MADEHRNFVQPLKIRLSRETDDDPFAAWRRQVAALFSATLRDGGEPSAFTAESAFYHLPNGFLTVSTLSAVELLRDMSLIVQSPNDSVLIFQCVSGEVSANYDGVVTTIKPGDFTFIDYQRPIWSSSSDGTFVSMTFGRTGLSKILRSGELHGVRLSATTPAAAVLSALTTALIDTIERLTVEEAETAFDAILRIAEVALRSAGDGADHREQELFKRALGLLREEMSDPNFSAARLQKALKISRASLYRLFAPYGGVRQFLIRVRLDASVYDLVGRKPAAGVISAAAFRHGFKSEAHFSRAFKQRFEVQPRDIVGIARGNIAPKTQIDAATVDSHGGADAMKTWLRGMIVQ